MEYCYDVFDGALNQDRIQKQVHCATGPTFAAFYSENCCNMVSIGQFYRYSHKSCLHGVPLPPKAGMQLARGRGEVSPTLFRKQKKSVLILQKKPQNTLILEKCTQFVFMCGLNSHLKDSFKSKTSIFFKALLFQETSSASQNFQLLTCKVWGAFF